jgi:hypothetical protein
MARPNLKWNRRAAVPVGLVGLAIIVYGLVKESLWFAVLGVIVLLFALFHRRLKSFSLRVPGRIEAKGEFVADLGGGEDETTPPEPRDAPPGPHQP